MSLFFSLALVLSTLILRPSPAAAQGAVTPTPRPLYALPDPVNAPLSRSGAIALAVQQRYLVTANAFSGTVSVVDIRSEQVLAEVPAGREPRALTVAPGEGWLAVTDHADGTVSLIDLASFERLATIPVGVWPWDVVTDGDRLYVALNGQDAVAEVDVAARQVTRLMPVPDAPAGLTLWGDFLYVTHFHTGALSLLYLPTGQVAGTAFPGPDTHLAAGLWLDPFEGVVYVPATRVNADSPALTFDTTVWPGVNVFEVRGLSPVRGRRLALEVANRPVNLPYAVSYDRARRWLWVVNAGSNDVSVIDLGSGFARASVPVGANPRGITRYADGSLAFVYNALDGTVSVIRAETQAAAMEVVSTIPVTQPRLPLDALTGALLFYGSADDRLSEDRRLSCATCHFDGGSDGRTWVGFPGGPLNTPALFGVGQTAPLGWRGDHDALADFNEFFVTVQHGDGLLVGDAERSPDLEALVAYLGTLQGPARSPYDVSPEQLEAGAAVFAAQGCAECHPAPLYTDGLAHDVGTGGPFDTPSLRWLWASGPYFHDGSAATLPDAFAAPGPHHLLGALPEADLDVLIAYLLSLPLEQPTRNTDDTDSRGFRIRASSVKSVSSVLGFRLPLVACRYFQGRCSCR